MTFLSLWKSEIKPWYWRPESLTSASACTNVSVMEYSLLWLNRTPVADIWRRWLMCHHRSSVCVWGTQAAAVYTSISGLFVGLLANAVTSVPGLSSSSTHTFTFISPWYLHTTHTITIPLACPYVLSFTCKVMDFGKTQLIYSVKMDRCLLTKCERFDL